MAQTRISLNERELATVLAALRNWQIDVEHDRKNGLDLAMEGYSEHFKDGAIQPLTDSEIDALCEAINR